MYLSLNCLIIRFRWISIIANVKTQTLNCCEMLWCVTYSVILSRKCVISFHLTTNNKLLQQTINVKTQIYCQENKNPISNSIPDQEKHPKCCDILYILFYSGICIISLHFNIYSTTRTNHLSWMNTQTMISSYCLNFHSWYNFYMAYLYNYSHNKYSK